MFKIDFLNFKILINRYPKEKYAELPLYYKENRKTIDLYFGENEFQFKCTITKDEFTGEFFEKFLQHAVRIDSITEMKSLVGTDIKFNSSDREILRKGIIAELDAINLYEQMSNTAEDEDVKNVLLSIIKEEKTHVGEFQALLLSEDTEQKVELKQGKQEISSIN